MDEEFQKQQQRLLQLQQQAQGNVFNRRRAAQENQRQAKLEDQRRRILISSAAGDTPAEAKKREEQHSRLLKAQLNIYASTNAATLMSRGKRRGVFAARKPSRITKPVYVPEPHEELVPGMDMGGDSSDNESEFSHGVDDDLVNESSSDFDSDDDSSKDESPSYVVQEAPSTIYESFSSQVLPMPISNKKSLFLSGWIFLMVLLSREPVNIPGFYLLPTAIILLTLVVAGGRIMISVADNAGLGGSVVIQESREIVNWLDVRGRTSTAAESAADVIKNLILQWQRDIHCAAIRVGAKATVLIVIFFISFSFLDIGLTSAVVLTGLLTSRMVPWSDIWQALEDADLESKFVQAHKMMTTGRRGGKKKSKNRKHKYADGKSAY